MGLSLIRRRRDRSEPRLLSPEMGSSVRRIGCAITFIAVPLFSSLGPAAALSEALARKCHALTLEQFPRPKNWAAYKPGDPAVARLRQAYYRACLAKEGAPNNGEQLDSR